MSVGDNRSIKNAKIELLVEAIEPWNSAELKVKLRGNEIGYMPRSGVEFEVRDLLDFKKGVFEENKR